MERRFEPIHYGSPRFASAGAGVFVANDIWFPPGLALPPHEHERTILAVTLEGSWTSTLGGDLHECRRGTLLTEPAGERHSNRFAEPTRVLILQVDPAARDELGIRGSLLAEAGHFSSPVAMQLARRVQLEIATRDSLSALAIEGLGREMLVAAGRQGLRRRGEAVAPGWLVRVSDFIRTRFLDDHTLVRLAEVAGVHPSHLSREFRRRYGTSVASQIRQHRLEWSAERLTESDQPIEAIARAAGFSDQSHFTRMFRRYSGTTPAAFRLKCRR